jgi:PAS domain S-box-containing protein
VVASCLTLPANAATAVPTTIAIDLEIIRYREQAAMLAILLPLIIALLYLYRKKKKAEAELHECANRFQTMVDSTLSTVWMSDALGTVTYLNERLIAFTGRGRSADYDGFWATYVHPEDRRNVHDVLSEALKGRTPFSNEYRLLRRDGTYRWMSEVASLRLNQDGSFAGFIGSSIDVTDQKSAQQALSRVPGQLIEAQERERRRIARELHDEICQELALLSVEIQQADRCPDNSSTNQRLGEIGRHCSDIARNVRSLSHQLHSSKLEYLGLQAAIEGLCTELANRHEIEILSTYVNVPAQLNNSTSLCLFRIVQEALHNAIKHSGSDRFTVELNGVQGELHVAIADAGVGFNVQDQKASTGLGLISMQERTHAVHGDLHIESSPGFGTRITAVVPITATELSAASSTFISFASC